jgi:hypothetical protein
LPQKEDPWKILKIVFCRKKVQKKDRKAGVDPIHDPRVHEAPLLKTAKRVPPERSVASSSNGMPDVFGGNLNKSSIAVVDSAEGRSQNSLRCQIVNAWESRRFTSYTIPEGCDEQQPRLLIKLD